MCGVVMTCGKTLDGAHDIEADNLIVNESSDLKGFTTVDGPSTFTQDIDLQNSSNLKTITLSASDAQENYTINLPSIKGTAGQFFTTDGLGNTQWSSVTPTVAGVSYIALVGIDNFIKVNGQASDSTYTSKTFNLELSGILPIAHGGTGLSSAGTADQVLSSNGGSMVWKTSSGAGLNILQTSPTLITPILGAATGTSLILSSLTASYSVHTDASKNLVSIQNSGAGLNILQTSPTLITPILGAATGTSLTLSSLTASYSVHTDASKNLVSVQNSGTGLNILQTSPTLITPTLGVASGTSLNLSSLTASYSVQTDSSKNLVSVQNSGTGLNILQTSPTLITPTLGVASGTSLNLSGLTASRLLLSDDSKNLVSLPESSSYGGVLVDGKNKQQVTSVSSLDLFVPGGTSIYPTGTSVQTEGFTVSSGFPDSGVNRRWTVLGGDSTKITITTVPLYPLQSGAPLGTVKSH